MRRDGRGFSRDVWRWRRLADISGKGDAATDWPPLKKLVNELMQLEPLVVSEVVALAAGWGDGPGLDMHSPSEVRGAIQRITDPSHVEEVVRSVIATERWQSTTWPHLLWEYLGEEPPHSRLFSK